MCCHVLQVHFAVNDQVLPIAVTYCRFISLSLTRLCILLSRIAQVHFALTDKAVPIMCCHVLQVHYAVIDKAVPIMCCHEACERPVAINDLTNLARRGDLNKAALTKAAVEAYVLTNAAAYRHCPTADCPAVYRVTPSLNTTWRSYGQLPLHSSYYESRVFVCPTCCTSTCTMCGESAHGSRPCSVAGSKGGEDVDEDSTVDDWAAEDSECRKRCPRCHCMIEKFDGCNKVVCELCKTIFCWVCRQTFTAGRACEDHLVRKHGGIFPDDYLQRLQRRLQARRH